MLQKCLKLKKDQHLKKPFPLLYSLLETSRQAHYIDNSLLTSLCNDSFNIFRLMYSQSFKHLVQRTVTTGIFAQRTCEVAYDEVPNKKPKFSVNSGNENQHKFNFKKVQLFISFMKAMKQTRKAQSNIRFDELMLAAKARLHGLVESKVSASSLEKGVAKLVQIWTAPEDQILLDWLQKSMNFTAIALRINELNKVEPKANQGKCLDLWLIFTISFLIKTIWISSQLRL